MRAAVHQHNQPIVRRAADDHRPPPDPASHVVVRRRDLAFMRNISIGHARFGGYFRPGFVHRELYTSPEIFAEEMRTLFGGTWVCLGGGLGHSRSVPANAIGTD